MTSFRPMYRRRAFHGSLCLLLAGVLTALPACINAPPVLDPVANQVVAIGDRLDLSLTASDPNGDALTFFGERLPQGAELDSSSGRLTWTPGVGLPRNHLLSVGARDPGDPPLEDAQNVMISVVEPGSRNDFGLLDASVRDAETGQLLAARVSIQGSDGRHYGGRFEIPHDTFFYTQGTFQSSLPPGPAGVTIVVGTECIAVQETVEIPPRQTLEREFVLERWAHMAEEGWFSGDVHIHANYGLDFVPGTAPVERLRNRPEDVDLMIRAEDLRVANFLVSNSLGDGLFDREDFQGRPSPLSDADHILYWNQEFRSPVYGHLSLLNLKSLVNPSNTGFSNSSNPYDYPPNADIADRVHEQGGLVIYAHPAYFDDDFGSLSSAAAREIGMDIALEKGDAMEVMSYACSSEQSIRLWYRVINCGYRIPAVAGTDAFLNWVEPPFTHGPPGGNRVYVRLDGSLDYPAWIAGLKAGRSFVTNGPVITLTVNGAEPGSEIRLDDSSPAELLVEAQVRAPYPLDRLEIVRNGQVVHTQPAGSDRNLIQIRTSVPVEGSCWIAARAEGNDYQPTLLARPLAHTNPVFVIRNDEKIDSREDRLYFVQQIDRLSQVVELRDRFASALDKSRFYQLLDQARGIHQSAADRSR